MADRGALRQAEHEDNVQHTQGPRINGMGDECDGMTTTTIARKVREVDQAPAVVGDEARAEAEPIVGNWAQQGRPPIPEAIASL